MRKVRVSVMVDVEMWEAAKAAAGGDTDGAVVDAALTELVRRHRRAEAEAAYATAYAEHPLSAPDAWGDLQSWHEAAGAERTEASPPAK